AAACSAAVGACARGGAWELALFLLRGHGDQSFSPCILSWNVGLLACERAGQWDLALALMLTASRDRLRRDTTSFNSAAGSCERVGQWEWALRLQAEMRSSAVSQDVITCNVLVSACSLHGRWAQSVHVFSESRMRGFKPSPVTLSAMTMCSSRASLWRTALELLAEADSLNGCGSSLEVLGGALRSCRSALQWQQALRLLRERQARSSEVNALVYSEAAAACVIQRPGALPALLSELRAWSLRQPLMRCSVGAASRSSTSRATVVTRSTAVWVTKPDVTAWNQVHIFRTIILQQEYGCQTLMASWQLADPSLDMLVGKLVLSHGEGMLPLANQKLVVQRAAVEKPCGHVALRVLCARVGPGRNQCGWTRSPGSSGHGATLAFSATAFICASCRSLRTPVALRRNFGHCQTKRRRLLRVRATQGTSFNATATPGYLPSLHPALSQAVQAELEAAKTALIGKDRELDVLLLGPKEEIGGVKGVRWVESNAADAAGVSPLRQMPAESVDFVIEVRSEELLSGGWQAWHNKFYPLGGHAFSLASDLIINLASIAKVLRPGGKFLFCTAARSEDELLPFAFLRLPHLAWEVEIVKSMDVSPHRGALLVWVICCTLSSSGAAAKALPRTPSVVADQCSSETSRKRYFDFMRPYLQELASEPPNPLAPLAVLDVGGGEGNLMAWAYDPAVVATDGPRQVTLLESNAELAARAAVRLADATVVHHEGTGSWPFADKQFDVVVLAFVIHHVPAEERLALLLEAGRVARKAVLVLEDQPQAASTEAARKLAWHVTEEHFRPFGQKPEDYIAGVLCDEAWRELFGEAKLAVQAADPLSG
ncbi:unnamed protein product, partial [Polarella glacialis]